MQRALRGLSNDTSITTKVRFRIEKATEKVNNITLSANDDNKRQTLDGVTTFLYGYGF